MATKAEKKNAILIKDEFYMSIYQSNDRKKHNTRIENFIETEPCL